MSEEPTQKLDKASRRLVWVLTGVMLFSFSFGILMFIPAENRAYKIDEMTMKYQAKRLRAAEKFKAGE
ncbi:MAG: hypothetical protein CMQ20_03805 [Gammaproteobacteria bacterium]|nr:hypothetical protein [Gammaproteobacteria bacterium]